MSPSSRVSTAPPPLRAGEPASLVHSSTILGMCCDHLFHRGPASLGRCEDDKVRPAQNLAEHRVTYARRGSGSTRSPGSSGPRFPSAAMAAATALGGNRDGVLSSSALVEKQLEAWREQRGPADDVRGWRSWAEAKAPNRTGRYVQRCKKGEQPGEAAACGSAHRGFWKRVLEAYAGGGRLGERRVAVPFTELIDMAVDRSPFAVQAWQRSGAAVRTNARSSFTGSMV